MSRRARPEGLLWKTWAKFQTRHPNQIVVIDAASDKAWTASALTEAALDFAADLGRYHPGDRIAFRIPNGVEWLTLFLALQRAGLAAIPLDAAMPEEGCLETARRLGARALYLEGKIHALGEDRPVVKRRRRIACIKLTSGTGAEPKAIACRAEHLLADGRHIIATMGIRARDINLAAIPLGHSYGLGNLVLPLILQGTAVVCAAEYLPRQLLEWIARHRVTVFPAVPALCRVLAALPGAPVKIGSLRTVISAGAMLSPAVAQAFHARFGRKVHNFYGSSETGGICYDRTGAVSLTGRSIGKPLKGVTVDVKKGHLTVTSAAVATRRGNWRLDDLGAWNRHGELVLLGRRGRGANIGGKKVHPLEVERLLRAMPGVSDAVVWLTHEQGRDLLVAGVETKLPRALIERTLAAKLPAWKLPKCYVITREFPRTTRGKISLPALKAQI